jgi:DNA-binding PadR family transcriptional regulator
MHHHHFSEFFHGRSRCAGRHGRRHGFAGLLGGVLGASDFGFHAFRAGRKLDADGLQLLILSLLAEGPAHGYEIIKALGERTGGFYNPSPGMVYPALTYLEEIGYTSVEAAGTRKLYSITDDGRAFLEKNRETVDAILGQLKMVSEKMEHVRRAFSSERDEAGMSAELRDARKKLKSALRDKHDASEDEQLRIAAILKRAAAEILGK